MTMFIAHYVLFYIRQVLYRAADASSPLLCLSKCRMWVIHGLVGFRQI